MIKKNRLLLPYGNETPLENFLKLAEFSRMAFNAGELDNNLRHLSPEFIAAVHKRYGGHGLTNLMHLAMGHDRSELEHFTSYLRVSLALQTAAEDQTADVELRNRDLPADTALHFFNTTYFQNTLARPLYAAGRHPATLSMAFQGQES